MAKELNDLRGDYMPKAGNVEDFSREFLLKLVRVYRDTQLFAYYAWTTAYGKRVGLDEAWDMAGEMSRGVGGQLMPMSRYIAQEGAD